MFYKAFSPSQHFKVVDDLFLCQQEQQLCMFTSSVD